jgi:hypothetical protein
MSSEVFIYIYGLCRQGRYIKGSSCPWFTTTYALGVYHHCMLRVRIPLMARYTTLCDKICQWLAAGLWFSPGHLVSSINETDRHDITEILLKVALLDRKNVESGHMPSCWDADAIPRRRCWCVLADQLHTMKKSGRLCWWSMSSWCN